MFFELDRMAARIKVIFLVFDCVSNTNLIQSKGSATFHLCSNLLEASMVGDSC